MKKTWYEPNLHSLETRMTFGGGGHGGDERECIIGCWGQPGQDFLYYWENTAFLQGNSQTVNITYEEAKLIAQAEASSKYKFS